MTNEKIREPKETKEAEKREPPLRPSYLLLISFAFFRFFRLKYLRLRASEPDHLATDHVIASAARQLARSIGKGARRRAEKGANLRRL